ncbi:MAG: hypothetical protein NTV51_30655 [Verrucomicrobia bacterium]|nr:hypothetical protein [Verrucomicrobiota bacterium]
MVSRDYTKEMGLNLAQKVVPLPYVLGLVVGILALGAFGFRATWPASHQAPVKKASASAPASVAVADK